MHMKLLEFLIVYVATFSFALASTSAISIFLASALAMASFSAKALASVSALAFKSASLLASAYALDLASSSANLLASASALALALSIYENGVVITKANLFFLDNKTKSMIAKVILELIVSLIISVMFSENEFSNTYILNSISYMMKTKTILCENLNLAITHFIKVAVM